MKKMSERVESEFKKYQDQYQIETKDEFQLQTLLELQEEYDNIPKESNTTRTRETLLNMIEPLSKAFKGTKKEYDYTLLLVVNPGLVEEYAHIFTMLIGAERINFKGGYDSHTEFVYLKINNGCNLLICDEEYLSNYVYNYKINNYINCSYHKNVEELLNRVIVK